MLFTLIHIASPWGLSLLSPRLGWTGEQPGGWNWLALVLVAAGIASTLYMISLHYRASPASFLSMQETHKVLVRGPYAYSRNPMYLSELAFWLGWALFYGSLTVLAGFLLFFAVLNFGAVPWEERHLEKRFGAAYRVYKATVPRWLGLPRGWMAEKR